MFKVPRVLVLGSTGMLGHQLCNYLINNSDYTLFDIARTSKFRQETALIDVRNERKLLDYIKDVRPNYIINCVGILISGSNKNIEEAIFINSYLPHMLARISDEIKSKLIHIYLLIVYFLAKEVNILRLIIEMVRAYMRKPKY